MGFDVVGVGTNVVDCILRLPGVFFPERRGNSPVGERPIVDWTIQGGGVVATAVATAARLGAKATMITTVGDDEWGEFVVSDFEKYGVDTSHIAVDSRVPTNVTFILVGENGSNRWVSSDVIRDWNLPEDVRRAVMWRDLHPRPERGVRLCAGYATGQLESMIQGKVLNLGGFAAGESLEAARIAENRGIPICYDMYSHPNMPELLKYITYCIPSQASAVRFTGETDPRAICRKLLSYGPEVAGVTLGEEGMVLATREEIIVRKAFDVPVVDTTGAGDVFHGAFSFAIVQGWDLAKAAEFSSAVSAMKCTRLGGRAGMPTLPEVQAFLTEHVQEIR